MLIMRTGSRPRSIKNAKALQFEEMALWQIKTQFKQQPLSGKLSLDAHIYYPSNRQDLDDTLLCDVLQHAGVIDNDRSIVEKHLWKHIDKENPRVELDIYPVDNSA